MEFGNYFLGNTSYESRMMLPYDSENAAKGDANIKAKTKNTTLAASYTRKCIFKRWMFPCH